VETIIVIDGTPYTFVTKDGATSLKIQSETTASKDVKPKLINLPIVWVVTRSNGVPLFALKPKLEDRVFRVLTAEKLYAEKIQWFEPLAHFYRELIWVNPNCLTQNPIKLTNMSRGRKLSTLQSLIDCRQAFTASFPAIGKAAPTVATAI